MNNMAGILSGNFMILKDCLRKDSASFILWREGKKCRGGIFTHWQIFFGITAHLGGFIYEREYDHFGNWILQKSYHSDDLKAGPFEVIKRTITYFEQGR